MTALDISISLVTLNQLADLKKLLPSLRSAASLVKSEILLLDNNSSDGTFAFIREHHPEINIRSNVDIAGYGENHNININRAMGRYIVIMNADMTVDVNVFEFLMQFMDQHQDVGIVAPKILNPDGSIQGLNKRYPTILDLFLRRFMPKRLQKLFRRRMDYYEMRDLGYDRECDVPFMSGAFMFCRSDLLKQVGGFDPRYFLYFEDADLSRRVQKTHRTMYCPATSVTHYWQRSAHKQWKFGLIFMRSAARYFRKWGIKLW